MEKSLEPEISKSNVINDKNVGNEDTKLSEVQIRELRQIQIVNFIQRTIVYIALTVVICGSVIAGLNQFMEQSGISFPLTKIHKYGYNSYFGGVIKLVKIDETITLKEEKRETTIESPMKKMSTEMNEETDEELSFDFNIPGTWKQIVDFYENVTTKYKPNFYDMIKGLF